MMNPKYRTPIYVALMLLGLNVAFGLVLQWRYNAIVERYSNEQSTKISQTLANIVSESGRNWQAKVKQYTLWQAQYDALKSDFEPWARANLVGTSAIEGAGVVAVFDEDYSLRWHEKSNSWSKLSSAELGELLGLLCQCKDPGEVKLMHRFINWKGKHWVIAGGSIYRQTGGAHRGYFVMAHELDAEFLSQLSLKLGYPLNFRESVEFDNADTDRVAYALQEHGQKIAEIEAAVPPFFRQELKRMMIFANVGLFLLSLLVWFGVIALYEKRHLTYVRKIQSDLSHADQAPLWWPMSAYSEDYRNVASQLQQLMRSLAQNQKDYSQFAKALPLPFFWIDNTAKLGGVESPLNRAIFGNISLLGRDLGSVLEGVSDEILSARVNEQLKLVFRSQGGSLQQEMALLPKELNLRSGRLVKFAWYASTGPTGYPDHLLLILRAS